MALLCYDPVSKRNPMKDLGALTMTKLTYGKPGTGKSMEIAAIARDRFAAMLAETLIGQGCAANAVQL